MNIYKKVMLSAALMFGMTSANASVITVTEDDLSASAGGETSMTGFYDTGAPLGQGALQVNGDGYVQEYLYWNPVGDDYRLGDLESLTFYTKSDVSNGFFVQIYTTQNGVNDGSWYGQRITFDTSNVFSTSEVAGAWTEWTTEAGPNHLMASDSVGNNFGPSNLTLSELLASTVANDTQTYDQERIMGIKIGTSTTNTGFVGAIDNVNFDFGAKGSLQFNFEPNAVAVPEPQTYTLFAMGLLLMTMSIRRAKQKG